MSMAAVVFKHPTAQGLRMFSSAEGAVNAGENPADLISIGGFLLKWPAALGLPPDEATLANWEAERVVAVDLESKRVAAEKALAEKLFEDALNDPNAPQAVKDYKQAKDK